MWRVASALFCVSLGVALWYPKKIVFIVDTIEDIDGECPSKHRTGEYCSYRQALQTVIDRHETDHVSIFLADATYKLTKPPPSVNSRFGAVYKSLSIYGTPPTNGSTGTVLDGQGAWQLLKTQVFINMNVSDILFVNGSASNTEKNRNSDGGAIVNGGSMVIKRCKFDSNFAVGTGGAIDSSGTLEIEDVEFRNNKGKVGGALAASGTTKFRVSLKATHVKFEDNSAEVSGALQNSQGSAT